MSDVPIAERITYCFVHTRPTLGVPTLDVAIDLGTGVEDVIEVFLVCCWPRRAVRE